MIKKIDKFLGKKIKSPLNTDVIYGGSAARVSVIYTVASPVVVTVVIYKIIVTR